MRSRFQSGELSERLGDRQSRNLVASPAQVAQQHRADTDFQGQVVSVFSTRPIDSRDFVTTIRFQIPLDDGGYGPYNVVLPATGHYVVPDGYTAVVQHIRMEGMPGFFPGAGSTTQATISMTRNNAAVPDSARAFSQIAVEEWDCHLVYATKEIISAQVVFGPDPMGTIPRRPTGLWVQLTISGTLIQSRGASSLDQASGPVAVKEAS